MSAGKLSKIENGRVIPSVQDVDLILTALEVSEEAKVEFLSAARVAATEEAAWRELRRMGHWKHQQAIQAIEHRTATLRLFQGQLIPGLLQTAEYAAAVFSLPPALPEETRAKTVAARLERQSVLSVRKKVWGEDHAGRSPAACSVFRLGAPASRGERIGLSVFQEMPNVSSSGLTPYSKSGLNGCELR